ncbi:NPCBM/NEW2 domain-containing protein, partial [Candidatus Poribacteria bacterium]
MIAAKQLLSSMVLFLFLLTSYTYAGTITVNSLADTDARGDDITLREAILLSEGTLNFDLLTPEEQTQVSTPVGRGISDTINFGISGTIILRSSLPSIIDDGTVMDASSQWIGEWPGGEPGIILSGGWNRVGLEINGAANCHVRGLFITEFVRGILINDGAKSNTIGGADTGNRNVISGNGIRGVDIHGNGTDKNVVSGNYIGTDVTGTAELGNAEVGIEIDAGAQWNTIGGTTAAERNIISENKYGVVIWASGTDNNAVKGNYIGTDVTGMNALGNVKDGFGIGGGAQFNIVGGATAGERNIISGNRSIGGVISKDAANNTVSGNYIGTDVTGTTALGNGAGVWFYQGAHSNTIGGKTEGAGNLISGNGTGVYIGGSGTDSNAVIGNSIGTDVTGTMDLGNSDDGVEIREAAQWNTIGNADAGNIIAFSGENGVRIEIGGTYYNRISGNFIHHNAQNGVRISFGPQSNTIGGVGAGNTIAFNGEYGVLIEGGGSDFNRISANSIHDNNELGIELEWDANDEIQPPNITLVSLAGDALTISGDGAGADATVEVFIADSSDQEGQTYLGSLTANGDGKFWGSLDVTGNEITVGNRIVATTTHTDDNTSEFNFPSTVCEYVKNEDVKIDSQGYIMSWLFLNPYIQGGVDAPTAVAKDYFADQGGEANLAPGEGDRVRIAETQSEHIWTRINFADLEDMGQIPGAVEGGNLNIACWGFAEDVENTQEYLVTYLKWDTSARVRFTMGSDDASELYFNGERLIYSPIDQAWAPGNAGRGEATVTGGEWNVLVVGVYETSSGWGATVRADPAPDEVNNVGLPPAADFQSSSVSVVSPLTVGFTDSSRGNPISWLWDFGDGETSVEQDPVHTYAKSGYYSVSLTVENRLGFDTNTKLHYVSETPCKNLIVAAEERPFDRIIYEDKEINVVYLSLYGGDTPAPNACGLNPDNFPDEWSGYHPADRDNVTISEGPGTHNFIIMGGILFERGIGSHAVATLVYDLTGGNYASFECYVGLPDEQTHTNCGNGSVDLTFTVDGAVMAETGVLTETLVNGRNATPTRVIFDIPPGAADLTISIGDGGDGIGCDHVCLGDAKLILPEPKTLSISSVDVPPGTSAIVELRIDDAAGIASGDIVIGYDANMITVDEVIAADLLSDVLLIANTDVPGEIRLSMAGATGLPEGSGALVEIGFTVNADAQVDTETTLSFSEARIYDEDGRAILAGLEDGVVKIMHPGIKGDVNNDGAVRSNDATLALRIAAQLMIPTEYEHWAADMNDDGVVRANDATLILRTAAGLAAPGIATGRQGDMEMGRIALSHITVGLGAAHGIAGERIVVPVRVDDADMLASGEICIAYDSTVLRAVDVLS